MSDATDALKVERKPIDGRHPLALELTRALGIDPSDCTGWTLRVEVDEFVSIEVRRTGKFDSLGKLKEVVERRALTVSSPLLDNNGSAPK